MPAKISNELGNLYISEDLLANIAGLAAMECYGIVGMATKKGKDGIVAVSYTHLIYKCKKGNWH